MRMSFRIILYFLLVSVILVVAYLFLRKNEVFVNLHDYSSLTMNTSTAPAGNKDQLNLALFKSKAIIPLVNQVNNFNFDNICPGSDGSSQETVVPIAIEATTSDNTSGAPIVATNGSPDSCSKGNNLPFLAKKVEDVKEKK